MFNSNWYPCVSAYIYLVNKFLMSTYHVSETMSGKSRKRDSNYFKGELDSFPDFFLSDTCNKEEDIFSENVALRPKLCMLNP